MSENSHPDLASQFRELGENLKQLFQSAWDSQDAQSFKEELKNGLAELGESAFQAVDEFKSSDTGQKLKKEAEDLKARVESGQVEAKARDEISKALEILNTELQKAIHSFTKPGSGTEA